MNAAGDSLLRIIGQCVQHVESGTEQRLSDQPLVDPLPVLPVMELHRIGTDELSPLSSRGGRHGRRTRWRAFSHPRL